MSTTQIFTGLAEIYTKGRPSYAPALIEKMKTIYGMTQKIVADIGSGTGILTKQLLDMGNTVYAVEPNSDMRALAETKLKDNPLFHSIIGTAEKSTLPDRSIDFITTATAFHWFDKTAFRKECKRILKPGGLIFVISNHKKEDEITLALRKVMYHFCPQYQNVRKIWEQMLTEDIKNFYSSFQSVIIPYPLTYSKEAFLTNCLSRSYSLQKEHPDFTAYIEALKNLFLQYQKDDKLTIANQTIAFIGQPA